MNSFNQPHTLYVNTKFSRSPSSPWNVVCNQPIYGAQAYKVLSAEVAHSWSSFSQYDNQIVIVVDTNVYTISLDTTKYYLDVDDLCSDIESLIRTATSDDTWYCIYLADEQRIKITPPEDTTFTLDLANFPAYERLGFYNITTTQQFTHDNPLIGDHIPNMNRTTSIYVTSGIGGNNQASFNRSDVICKLQVDKEWGNMLFYKATDMNYYPIDDTYIGSISLEVVDDMGRTIPDVNYISLEISFKYPEASRF